MFCHKLENVSKSTVQVFYKCQCLGKKNIHTKKNLEIFPSNLFYFMPHMKQDRDGNVPL